MRLSLEQKNSLKLTPELRQFMELLQMSAQELASYILNEATNNPLLDIDRLNEYGSPLSRLLLSGGSPAHSKKPDTREDGEDTFVSTEVGVKNDWDDTLSAYLQFQLAAVKLDPTSQRICRYLIGCVDERGYLTEDPRLTAQRFSVDPEITEHCFSVLRSFSPKGVCARDLKDCLMMQLSVQEDPLVAEIIDLYLDELSKGHYSLMAKQLHTSSAKVQQAASRIRGLSPRPSDGFASTDKGISYLVPDVVLVQREGLMQVSIYSSYRPYLRISRQYLSLLSQQEQDKQLRDYLAERMRAAESLIQNVNQRENTLLSCAGAVVELQKEFFQGSGGVQPMKLADVAAKVGLHSSTVSRTLKEKYIQCSGGIYPFKYFFSRAIEREEDGPESASNVQDMIRRLVEEEDKKKPLSDQRLCEELERMDIYIARRTVAKYREQLGIPSTLLRKRQNAPPND